MQTNAEPRAVKQCRNMLSINLKEKQQLSSEQLLASSFELSRLEALIARKEARLEKLKTSKLRRHSIGAKTKHADVALYKLSWERLIEENGNAHYPKLARKYGLYGEVKLTASIRADGSLEDITVDKTSGCEILDDHAYRTIKLTAPFKPFEQSLKDKFDILSFTRTFTYMREDDSGSLK